MVAINRDMQPMKISVPPGLTPGLQAPPGLRAPIQVHFENHVAAPPGLVWALPQKVNCPLVVDIAPCSFGANVAKDWSITVAASTAHATVSDVNKGPSVAEVSNASSWQLKRQFSLDESQDTTSTADTSIGGDEPEMVVEEMLLLGLQGSSEERHQALESITHQMWSLCKTQQGSRLVQTGIELASAKQLDAMLTQMKGNVADACKSPHGYHVMTKCIDVAGPSRSQFIIDELKSKAAALARDRFGCRVMQHLAECCPHSQVSRLMDEVMADAPRHLRHPYANFVVQSLLTSGPPARRAQIAKVLLTDAPGFSKHRIAKHTLRLAVAHCSAADRKRLIEGAQRPPDFFDGL